MGRARLVVAAIIALFAVITYFGSTTENPLTGEKQRVAMTPEQEIALGYQSAPQMAAQMGGVSRNAQAAWRSSSAWAKVWCARASPRKARTSSASTCSPTRRR